nr:type-F conjugative transfer system protein TraW [uncultured Sphingorhabdus sp.]
MKTLGYLVAFCVIAVPGHARDYGQQGALFPITEPDLLEQIQRKLMALQASGATAKLNEDLKRRTIAKVNRPAPVSGLGIASAIRSWAFDPTISVAEDISDDKGRIIMAAGTRVNPLDTVPLRQMLVFLDGDDPSQLDWATKNFGSSAVKLILVNGAPLQLMRGKQRRFYFDQGGKLVRHFNIKAVPATVKQQGRLLLITEHPVLPARRTVS